MQKWEYKVFIEFRNKGAIQLDDRATKIYELGQDEYMAEYDNRDSIRSFLPRLGENGWEMCGAVSTDNDKMTRIDYYFKRPQRTIK